MNGNRLVSEALGEFQRLLTPRHDHDFIVDSEQVTLGKGRVCVGKFAGRGIDGLEELRAIKQGEGPDLIIQGSSTIYPQLLEAGLIDELTLMISPVILGEGKRLFGDGTPPRTMKMTSHKVSDGGNIIATYAPAGPVKTGSFGEPTNNAAEQERQAAMADGSW